MYVCMCVSMYLCIYVCMYVSMYACMYVCLGKFWACKHWKFQNYFAIFSIFAFFCIWVCHFGFALSFFVICLSFVCHFFVISLSFFCHLFVILLSFWERENGKKILKKWLPWQTFCYLVAAPNTRNKCRNSWKASRGWRRIGQGILPWGIRFWAWLDEELSPGSGCKAGSRTGWGGRGRGEMAPGGAAQAREAGPTWKPQKRNFTSTPKQTQIWRWFPLSTGFVRNIVPLDPNPMLIIISPFKRPWLGGVHHFQTHTHMHDSLIQSQLWWC